MVQAVEQKIELVCQHTGKRTVDLAVREDFAHFDEEPTRKGFIYFFKDGSKFVIDQLTSPYTYAFKDAKGNVEQCLPFKREWK